MRSLRARAGFKPSADALEQRERKAASAMAQTLFEESGGNFESAARIKAKFDNHPAVRPLHELMGYHEAILALDQRVMSGDAAVIKDLLNNIQGFFDVLKSRGGAGGTNDELQREALVAMVGKSADMKGRISAFARVTGACWSRIKAAVTERDDLEDADFKHYRRMTKAPQRNKFHGSPGGQRLSDWIHEQSTPANESEKSQTKAQGGGRGQMRVVVLHGWCCALSDRSRVLQLCLWWHRPGNFLMHVLSLFNATIIAGVPRHR